MKGFTNSPTETEVAVIQADEAVADVAASRVAEMVRRHRIAIAKMVPMCSLMFSELEVSSLNNEELRDLIIETTESDTVEAKARRANMLKRLVAYARR